MKSLRNLSVRAGDRAGLGRRRWYGDDGQDCRPSDGAHRGPGIALGRGRMWPAGKEGARASGPRQVTGKPGCWPAAHGGSQQTEMLRWGAGCPSAQGQLIWRTNQLATLQGPKAPTRAVLKCVHRVPFLWETEELQPYSEARCPPSACREGPAARVCPQKNQRHRSGQTGPPAPGETLFFPARGSRPPRMNLWGRNSRP